MGNICFGGPEEKKTTALALHQTDDITEGKRFKEGTARGGSGIEQHVHSDGSAPQNQPHYNNHGLQPSSQQLLDHQPSNFIVSEAEQKAADLNLKAVHEEQERLEMIVQGTGRAMVPVRSQRGSTGYYDQGFAAALAQHLEQTTKFNAELPLILPPSISAPIASGSNVSAVYARLSQPVWDGIVLGNKGGENPVTFMDHLAEQCLDEAIPKKERLFANVDPIVENLL